MVPNDDSGLATAAYEAAAYHFEPDHAFGHGESVARYSFEATAPVADYPDVTTVPGGVGGLEKMDDDQEAAIGYQASARDGAGRSAYRLAERASWAGVTRCSVLGNAGVAVPLETSGSYRQNGEEYVASR